MENSNKRRSEKGKTKIKVISIYSGNKNMNEMFSQIAYEQVEKKLKNTD